MLNSQIVNLRQEIALVMHKHRDDRLLQLWLILRALDKDGSGQALCRRVKELDYLSWRSIRMYISKAEQLGLLWPGQTNRGQVTLCYLSEAKLYLRAIGKVRPFGHYFPCDVGLLNNRSLKELHSFFYVVGAYGDMRKGYSNPIARGKRSIDHGLKAKTGRSRKTQRSYERLMDVAVRRNMAEIVDYTPENMQRQLGLFGFENDQIPFIRDGKILAQISNSYKGVSPRAHQSTLAFWLRVQKVARTMDASRFGTLYSNSGDTSNSLKPYERFYYDSEQAAFEATSRRINSGIENVLSNNRTYGWKEETPSGLGIWTEFEG